MLADAMIGSAADRTALAAGHCNLGDVRAIDGAMLSLAAGR